MDTEYFCILNILAVRPAEYKYLSRASEEIFKVSSRRRSSKLSIRTHAYSSLFLPSTKIRAPFLETHFDDQGLRGGYQRCKQVTRDN